MNFNIAEHLPRCAFFTEKETVHMFTGVEKSAQIPADSRWIHWPDFYHLPFEFLTYQNHYVIPRRQFAVAQASLPMEFHFTPLSKPQFEKTFRHLQQLFQEKALFKAVPVVWSESQKLPNPEEISRLVAALFCLPMHFHCYGLFTLEMGILGASPEFLFSVESAEKLRCIAVAGTRLSEGLDANEFLNSPKDREEHQFVIHDIRHKLSKMGVVIQGETRVQNFGLISHLVTDFEVPLGNVPMHLQQLYLLTKSLHPTSALGLYSKSMFWKEAKDFPGQEGRPAKFGAPITFSLPGQVKSIVAIRNLIWDKDKTYLCVGCGVTAQSHLDKEWDELYNKRQAVMKFFGILS